MFFVVTTCSISGAVKSSLVLIWNVKDVPSLVQLKVLSPKDKSLALLAGEFNDKLFDIKDGATLIIGDSELESGKAQLKNMKKSEQREIEIDNIYSVLAEEI